MTYILSDYICFRGDLLKSEREFGEVDYSVLADLSYLDMKEVCESMDHPDLGTAVKLLSENGKLKIRKLTETREMVSTVICAGNSERFGMLGIGDYTDIFDEKDETQFSAVTWDFHDGTACVMFRGTDDTVTGWKEDFIASYTESHSQILAADYLLNALKKYRSVTAGGHSKGGNLALYAAMSIPKEKRENLEHLWLFDSPGLCEDMLDGKIMEELDKIVTFINPAESVVGRIFEYPFTDHRIVNSSSFSLMAHEMSTWQLDGLNFVKEESYHPASNFMAELIRKWSESVPLEERPAYVEKMFLRLENGKVHSVTELKELFSLESRVEAAFEKLKEARAKKHGEHPEDHESEE